MQFSTRILGRRTAPLPHFRMHSRAPCGFTQDPTGSTNSPARRRGALSSFVGRRRTLPVRVDARIRICNRCIRHAGGTAAPSNAADAICASHQRAGGQSKVDVPSPWLHTQPRRTTGAV